MSIYSKLAALLAALLISFSAVQLGLSAYILYFDHYRSTVGHRTFTYQVLNNLSNTYSFFFLPLNNKTRGYILQVATSVLAFVYGIAVLVLSFRSRPFQFVGTGKRAPRTIGWPGISIVLCLIVFCFALPATVISFFDDAKYGQHTFTMSLCLAQHADSSTVYSCSGTNLLLARPYTIEGWVCEMSRIYIHVLRHSASDNVDQLLPRMCTVTRISRWWTIALLVLPFTIGIAAFFEKRRRNIIAYNTQQEQNAALYPRQISYSSHAPTEVGNDSPVSPISTLPRYSSMNAEVHGKSRASESGGKMLQEVPEKFEYDEMPADQHQVYSELSASKSRTAVAKD